MQSKASTQPEATALVDQRIELFHKSNNTKVSTIIGRSSCHALTIVVIGMCWRDANEMEIEAINGDEEVSSRVRKKDLTK